MHKGDVIAVVDTAKSAIEVESFHSGTVERLVTPEGETMPVVTVLISQRSGKRIDEDDYPQLATLASGSAFLAA